MIIDISVGVISLAFVVLVVYLVLTLRKVDRLLKTTNALALDIKSKSETLDIFFRPLARLGKKKGDTKHRKHDEIIDIVDFVTEGVVLFNKLKKH
jgi:uncharacterized protein YoxC